MTTTTTARRMFELLEPICLVTFFADEYNEKMTALGHRTYWDGYFASRAARRCLMIVYVRECQTARLAAPGALLPSAYGKAVAFTVDITGQASSGAVDRDAAIAIRAAIAAPASRAPAGLAGVVTGPAAVNADSNVGN